MNEWINTLLLKRCLGQSVLVVSGHTRVTQKGKRLLNNRCREPPIRQVLASSLQTHAERGHESNIMTVPPYLTKLALLGVDDTATALPSEICKKMAGPTKGFLDFSDLNDWTKFFGLTHCSLFICLHTVLPLRGHEMWDVWCTDWQIVVDPCNQSWHVLRTKRTGWSRQPYIMVVL